MACGGYGEFCYEDAPLRRRRSKLNKNDAITCILLTNSFDMLSSILISRYGVYPPKSGQYRESHFHEEEIRNLMLEEEKTWAIYESSYFGILVFYARKGYPFFMANRGFVIASKDPIVDF